MTILAERAVRISPAAPRRGSRWILRDATAQAHARCERLVGPLDGPDAYRRFLAAMEAFHRAALAATAPHLPREATAGLSGDLDRLARDRADLAEAPRRVSVPPLSAPSPAGATGVLYVAEGARLGAPVLRGQAVEALAVSATFGARFLSAGGGGARWTAFLDRLELSLAGRREVEDAIAGALAAFDAFARAFGSATPRVPG